MPNRIILEIGAEQIEVPLKGTVTFLRAVIRRAAIRLGANVTSMTATEIGMFVLKKAVQFIMRSSTLQQQDDELVVANQTIAAKITADNDIVDP